MKQLGGMEDELVPSSEHSKPPHQPPKAEFTNSILLLPKIDWGSAVENEQPSSSSSSSETTKDNPGPIREVFYMVDALYFLVDDKKSSSAQGED